MFFKPKQTLIGYFCTNKFTFPIISINDIKFTFSHGNTQDIDVLFKLFPKLTVTKILHKKYDFIFLLRVKNQIVIIIDEYSCKDIINTLMDIKTSNINDWVKYSKNDNVIYPTFRTN
jgi:hypothetical protein